MKVIKQKELVEVKTHTGINLDLVLPQTTMRWIIAEDVVVAEIMGVMCYQINFPITAFTEDFLKEISESI